MLASKIMCGVIALLVLSVTVMAQEVSVTKTVANQVKFGDNLSVTITVSNNGNSHLTAKIIETVAGATAIQPQLVISQTTPGLIAALPPHFEWSVDLPSGSVQSVSYIIKPNKVGTYLISPTTVWLSNGLTVLSNSASVNVTCNSNGICEPNFGENYLTCPSDCQPWAKDGICNPARDGHCDPDCAPGIDLDCLKQQEANTTIHSVLPSTKVGEDNNWLLLALILIVVIIALIFLFRNKLLNLKDKLNSPRKPENTSKKDTPEQVTTNTTDNKYCPNCGEKLTSTKQKYCQSCGQKIKTNSK